MSYFYFNKYMGKLLFFIGCLVLTISVQAQCVEKTNDPCILVNSSYVADATKAFELLPALRTQVESLIKQNTAGEAQITALKLVNEAFKEIVALKDQKDAVTDKMFAVYERVIKLQGDLLDKLEARLNRPKSFLQKLGDVIKQIGNIAIGIAIGRGIGI